MYMFRFEISQRKIAFTPQVFWSPPHNDGMYSVEPLAKLVGVGALSVGSSGENSMRSSKGLAPEP
jgi:hypothetical protein